MSSLEQASDGISLQTQTARIESWCEATGTDLVEIVEDAGVSGSRSLEKRVGGRRIVDLLNSRAPYVDSVIICRLDRLGRDAAENLAHLRRFSRGKVGLVSILDRLDLSTPQGRAMAGVASVFSELERELIGQRTSEALARLRDDGRVYGPVPFGFRRQGRRLLVCEQEAGWAERIIERRRRGESFRDIAGWLNEQGVRAKRGGSWSPMAVRSVVLTIQRLRTP